MAKKSTTLKVGNSLTIYDSFKCPLDVSFEARPSNMP